MALKCPICGRSYKAAADLQQHKNAKHGGAVSNRPPPPAKARRGPPKIRPGPIVGKSRSVSGTDMLASVRVVAPGTTGARLAIVPLTPRTMKGTRLSAEAGLWTRWRPQRLTLRLVPSAGGLVSGMYTAGWSANPRETLPGGTGGLRKVAAYRPTTTHRINEAGSLQIPCDPTQRWYTLEGKDEETTHGVVHLVQAAELAGVTAGSAYTIAIHLEWTVLFEGEDLPSENSVDTVYAADGYSPYHTTSISDWAGGKKLTLKERAGGNAVPFPGLRHQAIYQLDDAASLKYKTAADAEAAIKYGVAIPGYYSPAMAVFADLEKAKKFASTGDESHCLDYVAAGPDVSPSNPAWRLTHSIDTCLIVGQPAVPRWLNAITGEVGEPALQGPTPDFHRSRTASPTPPLPASPPPGDRVEPAGGITPLSGRWPPSPL